MYGYDGGKLVKGRLRHLLVDTHGLVLAVVVTQANCPERVGGAAVVMSAGEVAENLQIIWVDQGYQAENFARVIQALCGAEVEVILRSEPGFQVLPKRWIVERTFGWLNYSRRLE